jgi:adsorption protein B
MWHEHDVIERMIRHNLRVLRYQRYEFFLGAYPNDTDTLAALARLQESGARVHICVCPHDGPTSKADCLNWIYQHMLLHEKQASVFFDAIITHDAEDLIHPDSLSVINRHLDEYDMVQIPVLPLPTGLSQWVHGLYCDEFAESQHKDLRARVHGGGFLPSCGVGTGLSRETVERLAVEYSNRVFEPSCLTEDYELGMRVHRMGLKQVFTSTAAVTREFFPTTFHGAIRQRTRWITGIALQSWQRHGWGKTWRESYWLWRDRKGLLGNPLSIAANVSFLYGLGTWTVSAATGTAWGLASAISFAAWAGLMLQCVRTAIRMACTAKFYGAQFAAAVPLRAPISNVINFLATVRAIHQFTRSIVTRTPLVWLKTQHSFPNEAALQDATARQQKTRAAAIP